MNERGKKLEPKLGIDMPFSEALERFLRVKTEEVEKSIETAKGRAAKEAKDANSKAKRVDRRKG